MSYDPVRGARGQVATRLTFLVGPPGNSIREVLAGVCFVGTWWARNGLVLRTTRTRAGEVRTGLFLALGA
jgi:hypothetical protein